MLGHRFAKYFPPKDDRSPFEKLLPLFLELLTHMLFQGMFFIITPALICGAFAERMKFSTCLLYTSRCV